MPETFAYQAQTTEGEPLSGTIDAADAEQANRLLQSLRLRVLEIGPVARPPRAKALRGDDFVAFNQQLMHLTRAGLPVEHGLKLIAQDMRRGRLAETVRQLAAELERGTPLDQAFERQRVHFPPLYAKLVAAGVTSGNLPGVLFNLGRHLELIQRLRAALWRAAAYPLMVLAGVALVLVFLSLAVVPQFDLIFRDFGTRLPLLTQGLLMLPVIVPKLLLGLAVMTALLAVLWLSLKQTGHDRIVMERLLFPLPLIGPILRNNLLARWCDALAVAVNAGLDLPRAIELADDAVASPTLRHDGEELRGALLAGKTLESVQHTRLLPASVIAALAMASKRDDLPAGLATLSEMYQQQAQLRLSMLPAVLAPVLLIIVALVVGTIIAALILPLISLIQSISSPAGWKK
jgi:type II secretory pathway component PulF